METKKCYRCKRVLDIREFFFNNKDHSACSDCCKRRRLHEAKPTCEVCGKTATFGFICDAKKIRCKKHILEGMTDLVHKLCENCNIKRALCNFPDEKEGRFCADCKLDSMFNIVSDMCKNCRLKHALFNHPTETKAIYCSDCKLDGMINVMLRKCERCGLKYPVCNYPGEKRGIFCADCKLDGMEDVESRRCIGCHKGRRTFNYPYEKPMYCSRCKQHGMINVSSRRCNCGKRIPCYNYIGEKPMYCSECKLPDMVNVIHSKCTCGKLATYGVPCNPPTRCAQHKEDGMLCPPNRKCLVELCRNKAEYGIKVPDHCDLHKGSEEICLVVRKCQNPEGCECIDVLDEKGLCINSCSMMEKSKLYKKHLKLQEEIVGKMLQRNIGPYFMREFIPDTTCGLERVDFVYDYPTYSIFTEVDETHGHRGRCLLGEINRMKNLFMSSGGKKIVFIRYNPESYRDAGNKLIKIADTIKHKVLCNWIGTFQKNEPEYLFSVVYLFYDGFSQDNIPIFEIDPYDPFHYLCYCEETFYVRSMYEHHLQSCPKYIEHCDS